LREGKIRVGGEGREERIGVREEVRKGKKKTMRGGGGREK
jgi:hypothetical protein